MLCVCGGNHSLTVVAPNRSRPKMVNRRRLIALVGGALSDFGGISSSPSSRTIGGRRQKRTKTLISRSQSVLIPVMFPMLLGWLTPANSFAQPAKGRSKFYLGADISSLAEIGRASCRERV